MKWVLEVWCTGVEGAAKVILMIDHEPTQNEIEAAKGSVSSAYKRQFRVWPMPLEGLVLFGHKITQQGD